MSGTRASLDYFSLVFILELTINFKYIEICKKDGIMRDRFEDPGVSGGGFPDSRQPVIIDIHRQQITCTTSTVKRSPTSVVEQWCWKAFRSRGDI